MRFQGNGVRVFADYSHLSMRQCFHMGHEARRDISADFVWLFHKRPQLGYELLIKLLLRCFNGRDIALYRKNDSFLRPFFPRQSEILGFEVAFQNSKTAISHLF